MVIKYLKKIIKNRINNRFIDVFDGNNKEWVELNNIILLGPYGIPITSNFKIIYRPHPWQKRHRSILNEKNFQNNCNFLFLN